MCPSKMLAGDETGENGDWATINKIHNCINYTTDNYSVTNNTLCFLDDLAFPLLPYILYFLKLILEKIWITFRYGFCL